MEATCQRIIYHKTDHPMSVDVECGAPIPRRCLHCGVSEAEHPTPADHERYGHRFRASRYVASECTAGHPVAMESE